VTFICIKDKLIPEAPRDGWKLWAAQWAGPAPGRTSSTRAAPHQVQTGRLRAARWQCLHGTGKHQGSGRSLWTAPGQGQEDGVSKGDGHHSDGWHNCHPAALEDSLRAERPGSGPDHGGGPASCPSGVAKGQDAGGRQTEGFAACKTGETGAPRARGQIQGDSALGNHGAQQTDPGQAGEA